MKALLQRQYGSLDFLEIAEVDKPVPGKNQVLIKVEATSINDWDLGLLNGTPFVPNRLMAGLFKPSIIVGSDVAGRVEAVGNDVSKFNVGDEVYGDLSGCGFGGFAEFVCAHENAVVPKPPAMSFEQAAAIPQASMLALQGLMAAEPLKSGHSVLINGAGGGVGSIAIQLLKQHHVEVTGVDSAFKLETMRSWGFDHVIDYQKQDFTHNAQCYDLILDVKSDRLPADYERVLNPDGVYATVGGSMSSLLKIALSGMRIRRASKKKFCVVQLKPNRDLAHFNDLFEAGLFEPVIDRVYNFSDSEVREAFHYFDKAEHTGKVVMRV